MSEKAKELVSHLRTIHFTLTVISLSILLTVYTYHTDEASLAETELSFILEKLEDWEVNQYRSMRKLSLGVDTLVQSEHNKSPLHWAEYGRNLVSFYLDEDQAGGSWRFPKTDSSEFFRIDMPYLPGGVAWTVWGPSSQGILDSINRPFGSNTVTDSTVWGAPRLTEPATLIEFSSLWDYFADGCIIYIPTYIDEKAIVQEYAEFDFSPLFDNSFVLDVYDEIDNSSDERLFLSKLISDPLIVTVGSNHQGTGTIEHAFANWSYGTVTHYIFFTEEFTSVEEFESNSVTINYAIPLRMKKLEVECWETWSNILSLDMEITNFDEAFPAVNNLSEGFQEYPISGLASVVELHKQIEDKTIEIIGIGFPSRLIFLWGLPLLLFIQLYFFIHYSQFKHVVNSEQPIPWVGAYNTVLSKIVFWTTSVLLPLGTQIITAVLLAYPSEEFGLSQSIASLSVLFSLILSISIAIQFIEVMRKQRLSNN